ncbi:mitogen-activated protein kinase kinase kinase 18-like [Setaria viridis]|uniref:mitogen-activated protein kinase kinase kinase 18-like n=1 Tax=Setaria viridis TaxID=4556 RepID=UPI0014937363|nr:mitogen-activated protein kinase kinase kinase 18-like [Setaria viridis]
MGAAFKQLRRLRTLGRGASGAVVWLAADEASGQLLAVKSAAGPGGAAEQLRREGRVLSGLRSPHIVPCLGSHADATGEYRLFLEFAPLGSLADETVRNGGCLEERDIRRYAADLARGLAYLHGESVVHGDVKAANTVVGGDGRAKLADFGCARAAGCDRPIAGTPAFMAPEVARGEEQGPAADVWALACTVIEMATGAAPWSDTENVYAAVHKIAYTDAVPELPAWLSYEAKDFLRMCLERNPRHRPTATQLLDHPFIVSAEPAKHCWASPTSTLNTAFWESDDDEDDEEEASESAAGRISSLASPRSALPDWDSEDGWIDVHSECSLQVSEVPAITVTVGAGFGLRSEPLDAAEVGLHVVDVEDAIRYPTSHVGVVDFVKFQQRHSSLSVGGVGLCLRPVACHQVKTVDRNSVVLVMTNEKSSFIMHKFGVFVMSLFEFDLVYV